MWAGRKSPGQDAARPAQWPIAPWPRSVRPFGGAPAMAGPSAVQITNAAPSGPGATACAGTVPITIAA
jgi:hypothetical protein